MDSDEKEINNWKDKFLKKCLSTHWISIKERLPDHQQPVLAFAITKSGKEGYGVAVFIDSIKMNEELKRGPYSNECVDVEKHPYYFVSQEQNRHTYNFVSHWMPLPEPPE